MKNEYQTPNNTLQYYQHLNIASLNFDHMCLILTQEGTQNHMVALVSHSASDAFLRID